VPQSLGNDFSFIHKDLSEQEEQFDIFFFGYEKKEKSIL